MSLVFRREHFVYGTKFRKIRESQKVVLNNTLR